MTSFDSPCNDQETNPVSTVHLDSMCRLPNLKAGLSVVHGEARPAWLDALATLYIIVIKQALCWSICWFLNSTLHVNELKIRNESESQGGSLTDTVEELLKGSLDCVPQDEYLGHHTECQETKWALASYPRIEALCHSAVLHRFTQCM